MNGRSDHRTLRWFVSGRIGLVCLLLFPAMTGARSPDPDRMMRRIERKISKEKTIRLETAALQFQMERPRLSGDTLRGPGDSPRIGLDEIREISVYRTYTRQGAGVGALFGVVAGVALSSAAQTLAESEGGQFGGDSGIALTAITTVTFAVVGALVALPFSGWKVIYRDSD